MELEVLEEPYLFDYLKEFYWPDLRKSSTFDSWDCISDIEKKFIELKSRRTHYDDLLIEKIKYDKIISGAFFLGFAPHYISATPQGVWDFDLIKIGAPIWSERMMPTTTDFENTDDKIKIVGFLPIAQGVHL